MWIPCFAYNEENEIKFLRGTSYVTTDENYLPSEGWTIPEALKNVTGVWVNTNSYDLSNNTTNLPDILYIIQNGTSL